MPDGLQPIVQRMIDAGESEENIATVIQHFKAQPQGDTYTGPDTYAGGFTASLKSQGRDLARAGLDALPGVGALVGGALSTPETLGAGTIPGMALGAGVGKGARDLIGHATGLDAPSTPLEKAGGIAKDTVITGLTAGLLPGVVSAARAPVQTARDMAEQFGSAMPPAIRRLGRLMPSLPKAAGPVLERPPWQTWETPPAPDVTPPPAATAPAASSALSAGDRAGLANQNYSPAMIAKIEAQMVGQPMKGQLQMKQAPAAAPPVQVDQASLPQSWRDLPHPLDPQRVDVGAQVTGRAHGMTKQQVRDVATPILDAKPGEASPILPEASLKRIVDTLKAMPPGSAEREAYVAKATSGKAQWQIENIRRTLEHLGLIVPVAAGAGMLRQTVMDRLNGGVQQ